MSYSFDVTYEYDSAELYRLRELTDDFVFCPKCGTKNSFEIRQTEIKLKHFCKRCSARLNDFWDKFYDGKLTDACCKACQQPTFEEHKYCISCGEIHYKATGKDQRQIIKSKNRNVISIYDVLFFLCCAGSCTGRPAIDNRFKTQRKSERIIIGVIIAWFSILLIVFTLLLRFNVCDNVCRCD
ncbi:MAG: hypothetical protein HZR80_15610 [Candidatus Heimdallarchaeota archaeon]